MAIKCRFINKVLFYIKKSFVYILYIYIYLCEARALVCVVTPFPVAHAGVACVSVRLHFFQLESVVTIAGDRSTPMLISTRDLARVFI